MLNILCVCGNGMGTSTILKINVKKICEQNGIEAFVDSCAFGEAMGYLSDKDLILTSPEWSAMIPPSKAVMVTIKNLIDTGVVTEALLEAVRKHFPDQIKQKGNDGL